MDNDALSKAISQLEDELVAVKIQSRTRADSSQMYRTRVGVLTQYDYVDVVVAPKDGIYDNLVVMPWNGTTGSGTMLWAGAVYFSVTNQCSFRVDYYVEGESGAENFVTIFSNKEIVVISAVGGNYN